MGDCGTSDEWEFTELVAVQDGQGRYAELDGRRVPGAPEKVLADLWEQGWEQDAVWYVDAENSQGTHEVFHQARFRRKRLTAQPNDDRAGDVTGREFRR